ncbi:hypothetical protein HY409_01975 [Candidatus Gottesmanbacteria bacterium]|nr:hypothetical protein [Candidatus Gottesmanbacteria bacterium]
MAKRKKVTRRVSRSVARRPRTVRDYLVIVRGWMFLVAFALMLGIGAIVGTFVNSQLEQSSPTVAGVQTEAR